MRGSIQSTLASAAAKHRSGQNNHTLQRKCLHASSHRMAPLRAEDPLHMSHQRLTLDQSERAGRTRFVGTALSLNQLPGPSRWRFSPKEQLRLGEKRKESRI